jgi:DNA polymerase III subunit gamma/tau
MAYIPLHHKYRPQTFADLVGQEAIATTLTNALRLEKIAPAYLFTGPRGTGKTSSARILAKSLNCMASQVPTAQPCGKCAVCSSIASSAALDIIEIDAASNTGVDNIRELIERAQYAPVQCRYKVYIIDECLTGDSLILTDRGWMQIDDPTLVDRQVLSYNERLSEWEWKQVLRWLERGEKETLTIKTTQREIRCTGNHLIGTDRGWIKAQDLKPGMKILAPISQSKHKQNNLARSVPAAAAQNYRFLLTYNRELRYTASNLQVKARQLTLNGCNRSISQDSVGGISTMVPSASVQKEVPQSICIQKDTLWQKTNLLLAGLQIEAIQPMLSPTKEVDNCGSITTSDLTLKPAVNGWQTYSPIPSPQWHTSLETIESVNLGGEEKVYDLEVEDNHNFVANGLLVHNCHMLTTSAFNSLLKTLEEPPDRVVFVLATTDPQRVLPTIISRCQRFDYRRIPVAAMVSHLTEIAKIEQIEIAPASVQLVAQIAQGGLRDAESLLDRLSLLDGEITPDRVYDAIGSVPERDLVDILKTIAATDPESLLDRTRAILERGKEPLTVLQNLAGCYRDLTIAKTAPKRPDLVALAGETWTEMVKIAQGWDLSWILAGQKHLKDSEIQLKHTTQPQLWLEIAVLGLLSVNTPQSQPAARASAAAPPPSPPPPIDPAQNALPSIQTPPAAIAVPPPAAITAPLAAIDTIDLASTWERVLQQLLPASRDLFRPFGKLISLSDVQAIVAMKSSTMQTIAAGKVPELAKVVSSICGRSIAVKLEVLGKSQPQPTATLQSPPPTAAPVPPAQQLPVVPVPPAPLASPPIPAAGEYLDDESDVEIDDDLSAEPAATIGSPPPLAAMPVPIAVPPAPEPIELVPPPVAPIAEIRQVESAPALDEPPVDFAEPPDSMDIDRAANQPEEIESPEIDDLLQAATDRIVNMFNGEIIDRHHELFEQIIK